jgi:hypothetical protein
MHIKKKLHAVHRIRIFDVFLLVFGRSLRMPAHMFHLNVLRNNNLQRKRNEYELFSIDTKKINK